MRATIPLLLLACPTGSCRTPVVKSDAFAREVLHARPLPGDLLSPAPEGEQELVQSPRWLSGLRPLESLTFVNLRAASGERIFALVLECSPASDRLVVRPLSGEESPIEVLADPARRSALRAWPERHAAGEAVPGALELSLDETVSRGRLGPPLPPPRRIFGAAANFPSHLENDLGLASFEPERERLEASRARVFLKYPGVAPPGWADADALGFPGLCGPYDGIQYPERIAVPLGPEGAPVEVELRLDYEVEVGAVFVRELTPEVVANATDEEIREAVGGYVLASDAKARNPQVAARLLARGVEPGPDDEPYRTHSPALERHLGAWNPDICRWWSYAAGFGNFSALGPFLVEALEDGSLPTRAMVSARSYADTSVRGLDAPQGLRPDVLFLRQCSSTTEVEGQADALVWDVAALVRSILAADSAVPFPDGDARIAPGDVLCLGTPGGTVITAPAIPAFVRWALFWWEPIDWHDSFFGRDAALYLRDGDRVFYWVDGLGFQRHEVRRVATGTAPAAE